MAQGDPESNRTKVWDPKRLFQRVNSPSFNFPPFPELTGQGRPMGTRTEADFASFTLVDFFARKKVIAMVPNWVRTEIAAPGFAAGKGTPSEIDAEHETFGLLRRSFQTWTDTPPFQWHRFYDWNFHVEPEPGLDWVRGSGNHPPHAPKGSRPVVPGHTLEIEWDAGSFGSRPGPMFNEPDKGSSLSRDWCWPMAGDHVWVVGRSIYDGGHPDEQGLSRSELHPCKATASARRGAFKFPGTAAFVPATQFMFFASRLGGYKEFPTLAPKDGKDFEFLVDLPLRPDDHYQASTHDVGATPGFPLHRIALREIEPLVFFDFEQHQSAAGKKLSPAELEQFKPIVQFERPKDEVDPRKLQARIKIPLLALLKAKGKSIDSYGVIVSLGWPDVNGSEAKKVKRCRVNFTALHPVQDQDSEIWRFKIGVNGRWFHWEREKIEPGKDVPIALPSPIEFFLPEDEPIRVNFHGAALRAVDDAYSGRGIHFDGTDEDRTVMLNGAQLVLQEIEDHSLDYVFPNADKSATATQIVLAILGTIATAPLLVLDALDALAGFLGMGSTDLMLMLSSRPADWDKDIDVQPPHAIPGAHASQNVVARNVAALMDHTLGNENNPLPLIDPGFGPPREKELNPLPLKGRNDKAPFPVTLVGMKPAELGKSAELVEVEPTDDPSPTDVVLRFSYTVQVEDQPITPPPQVA